MVLKVCEPYFYALMRIVVGFLFLWHGTQKLLDFPPMSYTPPPHVLYVAGPIELVGGALVMVGLLTHWVAFLCSGLMAGAYFMAHHSFSAGVEGLLPILNRGELAALYCFVFLLISAKGGGIWSIDGLLGRTVESGAGASARF